MRVKTTKYFIGSAFRLEAAMIIKLDIYFFKDNMLHSLCEHVKNELNFNQTTQLYAIEGLSVYVTPRSTCMSLAERDESDKSRNHVLLCGWLHKPF